MYVPQTARHGPPPGSSVRVSRAGTSRWRSGGAAVGQMALLGGAARPWPTLTGMVSSAVNRTGAARHRGRGAAPPARAAPRSSLCRRSCRRRPARTLRCRPRRDRSISRAPERRAPAAPLAHGLPPPPPSHAGCSRVGWSARPVTRSGRMRWTAEGSFGKSDLLDHFVAINRKFQ